MSAPEPSPGYDPADDAPVRRPRWLGVLLVVGVVVLVIGSLMTGWFIWRNYPLGGAASAASAPAAGSAAGLALVQASDCLRCHLPARKAVGPSWLAIADRHAETPEAVALLARKIREGSVGDWGRVIMPRHPQVNDADARVMAQWVLAQAPSRGGNTPAR